MGIVNSMAAGTGSIGKQERTITALEQKNDTAFASESKKSIC